MYRKWKRDPDLVHSSYSELNYFDKVEVGVYPYLDEELEREIRALGYPFDFYGITYVGTDDYDDICKAVPWYYYEFDNYKWAEVLIAPDAELIMTWGAYYS